jgi:rhodanese-related sulfurtransferase
MKQPLLAFLLSAAVAVPLSAQENKPAEPKPPKTDKAAEKKPASPVKNVSVDEAEKLIKETPGLTVLDVRSPEEFEHEHIKGAVNANLYGEEFEAQIAKLDRTKPVLVHCGSGRRSTMSIEGPLAKAVFPQIYHMNEGLSAWKKAGKPIEGKPLPKPDTRVLPKKPVGEKPAEKPPEK